jgi:hypothetical protein
MELFVISKGIANQKKYYQTCLFEDQTFMIFKVKACKIQERPQISLKQDAELPDIIYQLNMVLPQSKHQRNTVLQMDGDQDHLVELINKNF